MVVAALVIGSCTQANQPPVITSLTASPERVSPSGSCQVKCVASDPDGNKLSYAWSVNGGSISGEGSTVTWTAPNAFGTYTITVTVTDGRGGEATETIEIVVTCCI